ncbi:MAG TPA: hypothetical protein VF032_11370 [Thermoleophilaceae bacterium]
MKINRTIAAAAATLTLAAVPALALANSGNGNGPPSWANNHQGTSGTTGPTGTTGPQGHAYGFFCQGESKKHVAGTPGTPFSKCVHDMKALANGSATNPHAACKNESKKHVKGHKGTPYSVCVSGAKKLLKSQS